MNILHNFDVKMQHNAWLRSVIFPGTIPTL